MLLVMFFGKLCTRDSTMTDHSGPLLGHQDAGDVYHLWVAARFDTHTTTVTTSI